MLQEIGFSTTDSGGSDGDESEEEKQVMEI